MGRSASGERGGAALPADAAGGVKVSGEAFLRVRLSARDAHYGGGLVDGARILGLFGDAATELLIRHDGDEGLFVAYDLVEFKAPVYAGDFVEVRARITRVGNTSRAMEFEAYKVIEACPAPGQPSRARCLDQPVLVARARGTCVVPRDRQRRSGEG